MKLINTNLLNSVSEKAVNNERLRMNYNFHTSAESKSQRLLNALEPGTKVPVHRHKNTAETYILLRGSLRVLLYNLDRELVEVHELNTATGEIGIDIEAGEWHTLEVLESGTVIFEVKDGPYKPMDVDDILF